MAARFLASPAETRRSILPWGPSADQLVRNQAEHRTKYLFCETGQHKRPVPDPAKPDPTAGQDDYPWKVPFPLQRPVVPPHTTCVVSVGRRYIEPNLVKKESENGTT